MLFHADIVSFQPSQIKEENFVPELLEKPCSFSELERRRRIVREVDQRGGSCGWMCSKPGCFSNCTRERAHVGNHHCGAGHSY